MYGVQSLQLVVADSLVGYDGQAKNGLFFWWIGSLKSWWISRG